MQPPPNEGIPDCGSADAAALLPRVPAGPVSATHSTEVDNNKCAVCLSSLLTAVDTDMHDAVTDLTSLRTIRANMGGDIELASLHSSHTPLSGLFQQQQITTCGNGCIRLSACGHTFHERCILGWLQHSVSARSGSGGESVSPDWTSSCPICRCIIKIPAYSDGPIGGGDASIAPGEFDRAHSTDRRRRSARPVGRYQWKTNQASSCVFKFFLTVLFGGIVICSIGGALISGD